MNLSLNAKSFFMFGSVNPFSGFNRLNNELLVKGFSMKLNPDDSESLMAQRMGEMGTETLYFDADTVSYYGPGKELRNVRPGVMKHFIRKYC